MIIVIIISLKTMLSRAIGKVHSVHRTSNLLEPQVRLITSTIAIYPGRSLMLISSSHVE